MNHPSTDSFEGGASLQSSVFGFQTSSVPPVPPQAVALVDTLSSDPVPLQVRRQRVRNGSKRKRDLAAVRMAEELELLERIEISMEAAGEHWDLARAALRASVPESTWHLWLEPLVGVAVDGDTLVLAAPERVWAWTERRYSHLIEEALLAHTPYEHVRFVCSEEAG